MWNPNLSFRRFSHGGSFSQQKRKLWEADAMESFPPCKLHITEEKMVSQLSGLHLSKEYTSHGGATTSIEPQSSLIEGDPHVVSIEGDLEETIRSKLDAQGAIPSLSVCDEIRALQHRVDAILPESILERFQKPSTALVLWQPPTSLAFTSAISKTQESPPPPPPQEPADIEMNEEDDNNNGSANDHMNILFDP